MRLFVAFDLPNAVRNALATLAQRLKPECRAARWVRTESMHVTLKFLGETDLQNISAIRAALAPIRSAQPVAMDFRVLGFFPNEFKPRILWCGVQATPNLAQLAAAVEEALEPLGFAREARAYFPHLTLARLEPNDALENLLRAADALKTYDFGAARESEFHLFESVLKPSGAQYSKLAAFPFVEGAK
ncbi:MAG TPA: RNA 2',3'-cyclic phosphodiesterase [Candidatus Acidoferrales bacterium]|nr:RNA 2',3'-cyclic phosphodiesterase [Candidatus Acidoferrales bacterium]